MENNIEDYMKLDSTEKSSEFYYDGVPSIVTSKNEEYIENTLADSYKTSEVEGVPKLIRFSFTIIQVIFILLGILLIMKGISNYRKNKQINGEYDDTIDFESNEKIRKKTVLLYFIFSCALFFGGLIIHIVKNYANNL